MGGRRIPISTRRKVAALGSIYDAKTRAPKYTLGEIANKVDESRQVVSAALAKAGIQRNRGPRTQKIIELALETDKYGRAKYSADQIAEQVGLSADRVGIILKNNQIRRKGARPRRRIPEEVLDEIVRLGSIHNLKTRKPAYLVREIAEMVSTPKRKINPMAVSRTLMAAAIKRKEERGKRKK